LNGGREPAPLAASARPRAAVLATAVVFLALIAQVPALKGGFFSDDLLYVRDNFRLQQIPLSRFWRFFEGGTNPWEYLPVRDLSFRVDLALFGLSPLGFKLENLVLYALACTVCFLAFRAVVRVLRGTRDDLVEDVLVVGAMSVFAVHPAHVESVAWIASRKDLLSGLFAITALWQFAEALAGERPSWRRIALAAVSYELALLSKATVIPLAAVLLLLALARFGWERPFRATLGRAIAVAMPFVALSTASTFIASRFSNVGRSFDLDAFILAPVAPAPLALRILGTFAHVALAPVRLRLHYDVRVPGVEGAALVAAGALVAIVGAIGAWAAVRRRSIVGFGVATFVLFTVPFLQLVPSRTWSEMCERWLFLPSVGLALAAGALAATAMDRIGARRLVAATGVVFAAGLAQTMHRSFEWASVEGLTRASLARSPTNPFAVVAALLAHAPDLPYEEARAAAPAMTDTIRERLLLIADGWQALAEARVSDARQIVRELAKASSPSLTAPIEAALAEQAGDDFEALRLFESTDATAAMRLIQERYRPQLLALERRAAQRPGDAEALGELANLQTELRLNAEAVETYRRIVRIAPDLAGVHYNLGLVRYRDGAYADAAAEYRIAAAGIPDAWNGLGLCEQALGHVAEAEQAFRRALEADPLSVAPAYNLAMMYASQRRREDAHRVLLLGRERAAARNAPVAPFDALLLIL